jgi:hypothetical protein
MNEPKENCAKVFLFSLPPNHSAFTNFKLTKIKIIYQFLTPLVKPQALQNLMMSCFSV